MANFAHTWEKCLGQNPLEHVASGVIAGFLEE